MGERVPKSFVEGLIAQKSNRIDFDVYGKGKSEVWANFSLVSVDKKPVPYACCGSCKGVVSYASKTGTGSLQRHKCSASSKQSPRLSWGHPKASKQRATITSRPAHAASSKTAAVRRPSTVQDHTSEIVTDSLCCGDADGERGKETSLGNEVDVHYETDPLDTADREWKNVTMVVDIGEGSENDEFAEQIRQAMAESVAPPANPINTAHSALPEKSALAPLKKSPTTCEKVKNSTVTSKTIHSTSSAIKPDINQALNTSGSERGSQSLPESEFGPVRNKPPAIPNSSIHGDAPVTSITAELMVRNQGRKIDLQERQLLLEERKLAAQEQYQQQCLEIQRQDLQQRQQQHQERQQQLQIQHQEQQRLLEQNAKHFNRALEAFQEFVQSFVGRKECQLL